MKVSLIQMRRISLILEIRNTYPKPKLKHENKKKYKEKTKTKDNYEKKYAEQWKRIRFEYETGL